MTPHQRGRRHVQDGALLRVASGEKKFGLLGQAGGCFGVCDFFKFRVELAQGFGYPNGLVSEQADQLQGVCNGFALEMVIGNNDRHFGVLGNILDARHPRFQFC